MRRDRFDGLAVSVDAAEGLLELGDGAHETAYVRLERVVRLVGTGRAADPGWACWIPDFVEAAVQVGRGEEAHRVLDGAQRQATGSPLLPAVVARCRALLAPDVAEARFQESVAVYQRTVQGAFRDVSDSLIASGTGTLSSSAALP